MPVLICRVQLSVIVCFCSAGDLEPVATLYIVLQVSDILVQLVTKVSL